MESDHLRGRRVAGFVGVEAAVDFVAAGEQSGEPEGIGADAGGGEAEGIRVHLVVADRIDGRLAEDELPRSRIAQPEESQVFAGAGRHPPPDARAGASQFGADRPIGLSCHQQEDGIGSAIGVQLAGLNQRLQQGAGKTTALHEILADAVQLAVAGDGQPQGAAAFRNGGRVGRSRRWALADDESAGAQMLFQPGHRRADIDLGQVHHQVDRSAAAVVRMPGGELGTGDRQRASFGVPFGSVVRVADRARTANTVASGIWRTASARRRNSSKFLTRRLPAVGSAGASGYGRS